MVRRILLSMLAGVMALGVMAQSGKFTLSGRVEGQGSWATYALTDAWGEGVSQERIKITDDKVDFSFDLEDVGWLMVFSNRMLYSLPVVPGEAVTISGDIDNYTFGGSELYKEYNEAMSVIRPLLLAKQKYDFKQACRDEIAGKTSEQVFDLYQRKMRENSQPVNDAVLAFIGKHPDHESSMMVLNYLNDAEDLKKAHELISEQVFNGRMSPYYEAALESSQNGGASNPLLGQPAPDIKLKDVNGKKLSLKSLRGKWVLLDFWHAECGNAVTQFPLLKMTYEKYKNHVEILGVDCIDEEQDWKSAVKRHRLPWLNAFSSRQIDDPKSPMGIYGCTRTPAYFLIAPSGKVAMTLSSADEFKYMCELLFE